MPQSTENLMATFWRAAKVRGLDEKTLPTVPNTSQQGASRRVSRKVVSTLNEHWTDASPALSAHPGTGEEGTPILVISSSYMSPALLAYKRDCKLWPRALNTSDRMDLTSTYCLYMVACSWERKACSMWWDSLHGWREILIKTVDAIQTLAMTRTVQRGPDSQQGWVFFALFFGRIKKQGILQVEIVTPEPFPLALLSWTQFLPCVMLCFLVLYVQVCMCQTGLVSSFMIPLSTLYRCKKHIIYVHNDKTEQKQHAQALL